MSHLLNDTILTLSILAISDSSCSQLAVLDESLNLSYRFILVVENNAKTSAKFERFTMGVPTVILNALRRAY